VSIRLETGLSSSPAGSQHFYARAPFPAHNLLNSAGKVSLNSHRVPSLIARSVSQVITKKRSETKVRTYFRYLLSNYVKVFGAQLHYDKLFE
jgi:hypothetical protein